MTAQATMATKTNTAPAAVRIAPPDSAEEREADRVAAVVLAGGAVAPASGPPGPPAIHRQCASCSAGGPPCADCAEEPEPLRLKPAATGPVGGPGVGAGAARSAAASVAQGGRPLPQAARSYFEPRFGTDLSGVRIHTARTAAAAAQAIGARAFALGDHIAFAPGQFAPQTQGGRRLIAHELAHVVTHGLSGEIWREPEDCDSEAANTAKVHDVCTSVITADGYAIPVPYLAGFSVEELACLLEKLDTIRRENVDDDEIRMRVMGFVGDRLNPALTLIQRDQPEQSKARRQIGDALLKAERLQRDVSRTLGPLSQGHVAQEALKARKSAEAVTEREGDVLDPREVEALRARAKFAARSELNFDPDEFRLILAALSIVEVEISQEVALRFYRTYAAGTLGKDSSVKPWAETKGDETLLHPAAVDGRLSPRTLASILVHEFGGHIEQPGQGGQGGVVNYVQEARPYAIDLTSARLLGDSKRESFVTKFAEAKFIDDAPAAANFCVSVAALWTLRQASNAALPNEIRSEIGDVDRQQAETLFDEMMSTIPGNYSADLKAFIERIRAGFFKGGRELYGWIARNADIPDVCTGRESAETTTPETIRNGSLK